MKKMFPRYEEVSHWQVLENAMIYDFTEDENPIEVVKVNIGNLEIFDIDINNHLKKENYPIIRWLAANEYKHLKAQEGMIIW